MTVLGYYRYPTIYRDQIVFVAEDDLWAVGDTGGVARRLTANPGVESYPHFSPDGSQVAFVSRDEGPPDCFVMPAGGGPLQRVSFFGDSQIVAGWSPAGKEIYIASDWGQPFAGWMHLHAVPTNGKPSRPLSVGPAFSISQPSSGKGMVIGRNAFDPARWKRYRGGRSGSLWIDRNGRGSFQPLIELEGNLASPLWIGSRIYFLSDHEGHGNIYSVTTTGKELTRHTHHDKFYARHPDTDGERIVYHCGADLWLLDPSTETSTRLQVSVDSPQPQRQRRFIKPGKFVSSIDLHPQGLAAAITVRGRVYSMPLWEHSPLNLGEGGPYRQRLGTWLSDGNRIALVTDQNGEEEIEIVATDGETETKKIRRDFGRIRALMASPAGTPRLAITNHRHELLLLSVNRSSLKTVYHSPFSWIGTPSWSPDGRWVAFAAVVSRTTANLFLYDTRTAQLTQIDRPRFQDRSPSFDPGGKFLYFVSGRTFDPIPDMHFHNYGFSRGTQPYLLTLANDTRSPFDSFARIPYPPGGSPPPTPQPEGANGKGDDPVPTRIDLEDIENRVNEFPVPAGVYGQVAGANGRMLMLQYPERGYLSVSGWFEPPTGSLYAWDFATENRELVAEGVESFGVSADGKVVGWKQNSKLRVVGVGEKPDKTKTEPNRSSGWVDLARIQVEVNPPWEWEQMFNEAWRLQRDNFWHHDMTGVNWDAVRERYGRLVARVGSRWEFSDLLWEMQGELGTSHAYELGGDYLPQPTWSQGSLGADFVCRDGRWIVDRIPMGDSWNREASSPLSSLGADIQEGDALLAIDGQALSRQLGPDRMLVNKASQPVELLIKRGRTKPRRVMVKALGSDRKLRYRDWVETNRSLVTAATEGRAGYLHIPDMQAVGFSEFHRGWLENVDREGLVIDVRFNRGGSVSQLLLEKLIRTRLGYRITRRRLPFAFPTDSPAGPMVCLTNEMAGSDGDIFSHSFKQHQLGPLIGTRTWGGVIGIFPQQGLVDGTITTQPEYSTWFHDVGFGVENYGTDPDIVVANTPSEYRQRVDSQLERGIKEIISLMDHHPDPPEFGSPPSTKAPKLPQPG